MTELPPPITPYLEPTAQELCEATDPHPRIYEGPRRRPPNPHHPPPPSRFRRLIGRVTNMVGTACVIGIPMSYFQGYEELAGGLIAAAAGLFALSSKIKPDN